MAEDGTAIVGERLPGAGPQVVLLHAGVADRRAWGATAAGLGESGAAVTTYDRRGFGETPGCESSFDHVDDLVSVLDQSTNEPAWLVGNSEGGRIALDLAVEHPERVAGLVLIAPAVSGAPEPGEDELDPATREALAELARAEESGDMNAVNEAEVQLWLDGPAGPGERVEGQARALAVDMNAIALASPEPGVGGHRERDTWSRLGEIEAAATVAWGSLDVPIVIEQCRVLAERLGNLRKAVELPGVAHLPMLESPAIVVGAIRDALES